jgi:hypothetical protein
MLDLTTYSYSIVPFFSWRCLLFSVYCLICAIVLSTFVQWTIVLHWLLFSPCYCSDCRYYPPLFGSTITCTSISRASAGSLYPSFGFNINLLPPFSHSLILLLLTLLVALIRHIGAWWCAITSQESVRHYHRVAQTPTLGEAPLEPSLEPGPSRAVTLFESCSYSGGVEFGIFSLYIVSLGFFSVFTFNHIPPNFSPWASRLACRVFHLFLAWSFSRCAS